MMSQASYSWGEWNSGNRHHPEALSFACLMPGLGQLKAEISTVAGFSEGTCSRVPRQPRGSPHDCPSHMTSLLPMSLERRHKDLEILGEGESIELHISMREVLKNW